MRRIASLLIVLAVAPIAAGCGSEDLPSVSAAEAAARTRDAKTARIALRMEMSGYGLPQAITVAAEGVTALDSSRMNITYDLGSLLDAKGRVLLDGRRLYGQVPDVDGLELPNGASWVTVDLLAMAKALGFDPAGLGDVMRMTPQQQLDALEATGSMKKVGEEEVDGVRTTHLRGSFTLRDYARSLPPAKRRAVQAAIRRMAKLAGEDTATFDTPTPTDMWVDEDAYIRRMKQSTETPAQQGVPGGKIAITTEFTDFGAPLELDPPEGDDVYDATGDVVRMIGDAF